MRISAVAGRVRRILKTLALPAIVVGLAVLVVAAIQASQRSALAAPEQPIDFSHRRHAGAGIQCLFCHTSPMRSDVAGMPSVQRCVGCHRVILSDRRQIQLVLGYWERGEPIPWQRVTDLPDHVFFSHQPHLQSGLSCETCHGSVAQMGVAQPAVYMDMGWCLDCHLQQPDQKVGRLADCLTCHK